MREPSPPYILAFGLFRKSNVKYKIIDPFYSSVSHESGAALNLSLIRYDFPRLSSLEIGNIGIEVKLSEEKQRMEDLTRVSKQVVIATHGMAMEIENRAKSDKISREEIYFFIPVIVTTAKLFIADADISKVEMNNGKLELEGLKLNEVDWVVYEYPITAKLLLPVNTCSDRWDLKREDNLRRRHIFVVNSEKFKNFLESLRSDLMS